MKKSMNLIKKVNSIILAVILCLSTISCGKVKFDFEKNFTDISVDMLKGFMVIYSDKATAPIQDAAIKLSENISKNYGSELTVKNDVLEDWLMESSSDLFEVLIGRTNRKETEEFISSLNGYYDYGWTIIGNKLVICGGCDEATVNAVNDFIESVGKSDKIFYSSSSDKMYHHKKYPNKIPKIYGEKLSEFEIVYEGSDADAEHLKLVANEIADTVGEKTGVILPISDNKNDNGSKIYLKADANVGVGTSYYIIEKVKGGKINITFYGDTYYTVKMAVNEFLDKLFPREGKVKLPELGKEQVVRNEKDYEVDNLAEYTTDHAIEKLYIGDISIDKYTVVYGKGDTGDSENAAKTLADSIEKATGVKLQVVDDSQSRKEYEILVGTTNRDTDNVKKRRSKLKNDGIMYYSDRNKLYLSSHTDTGQIYAIYHFLEDYLGFRYFSENFKIIYKTKEIYIPISLDYSYSPTFAYRLDNWSYMYDELGINGGGDPYGIVGFGHSLKGYAESSSNSNVCLSDEKIYQTVLKNLRNVIEENPNRKYFTVTQNDGDKYCKCDKCSALAEEENMSGVMLTFVNRLAEEIEDEYPDVKLITFAYTYTQTPPKTIKAHKNVIIWLSSIGCCFSHSIDDTNCNLTFQKDMNNWKNYANEILIWDYTTNFDYYSVPFPNLYTLWKNASYFADNNVIGVFEQGCTSNNGEFRDLKHYLIGKLLWNPNMTEEEYYRYMDEFLECYYGTGWKYIRYYIDMTTDLAAETDMGIYGKLPMSTDYNEYLLQCWEKAINLADDETSKKHCSDSSIQAYCLEGNYDPNGTKIRDMLKGIEMEYFSERFSTKVIDVTNDSEILNW